MESLEKSCHLNNEQLTNITNEWKTRIDKNVNEYDLASVIISLMDAGRYEYEYLLYLVKLGGNNHWLHHPFGLFTAVKNDKFYEDFCKIKIKHNDITVKNVCGYERIDNFKMNKTKTGFLKILGR